MILYLRNHSCGADQQQVVIEQVTSTPLRPGAPATSLARTKSNLVGEGLQPQPGIQTLYPNLSTVVTNPRRSHIASMHNIKKSLRSKCSVPDVSFHLSDANTSPMLAPGRISSCKGSAGSVGVPQSRRVTHACSSRRNTPRSRHFGTAGRAPVDTLTVRAANGDSERSVVLSKRAAAVRKQKLGTDRAVPSCVGAALGLHAH